MAGVHGRARFAPSAVHGFHPYMNHKYSQIGIKSHTMHGALRRLSSMNKDTHTHTDKHAWNRMIDGKRFN